MTTPHRAPYCSYFTSEQIKGNETRPQQFAPPLQIFTTRIEHLFLPGFSTKLSNPTKSTIMSFLINCLPYPSNQAELFADDYCKTEEAEKVMSDKIELEANFHNSFSVESPSRIAISSPGHHYCFESEKKEVKMERKRKIANFDAILRPTSAFDNSTYFTSRPHTTTSLCTEGFFYLIR